MSKVEVYLDDEQISNLKSILSQSEYGIHVLFENKLISDVFKTPFSEDDFFQVENIKEVQAQLLKLLHLKGLTEKRNFIFSLSKADQHRLVRAYFYIIENNLRSTQKHQH